MHVMRPKNSITFMTFVKIEMDIVKTETLAKIVIIKPLNHWGWGILCILRFVIEKMIFVTLDL